MGSVCGARAQLSVKSKQKRKLTEIFEKDTRDTQTPTVPFLTKHQNGTKSK